MNVIIKLTSIFNKSFLQCFFLLLEHNFTFKNFDIRADTSRHNNKSLNETESLISASPERQNPYHSSHRISRGTLLVYWQNALRLRKGFRPR